MIKTFSINEEMKGLIPITNRGEHTSEDAVKTAFSSLGNGDFRDASVYLGSFDGNAGWERQFNDTTSHFSIRALTGQQDQEPSWAEADANSVAPWSDLVGKKASWKTL